MGNFTTKIGDALPSTRHDSNTTPSMNTKTAVSPQEIIYWEEIYKERFSRAFIFSTFTLKPLFSCCDRNPTPSSGWEDRLNTDSCWNRCNPRYIGATPEPLTTELAERTRHELRNMYHGFLIHSWLRSWLKEAWLARWTMVPRVPYLNNEVAFPPASEIKNGYILPARVRAYILGQSEEVAPDKDPFLTEKLQDLAMQLRLDHPSQVPYEDRLLRGSPWLNQTTAIYFEPVFENLGPHYQGLEYIGRGLFAAWREVDKAKGEAPNLQQFRYFANPVMLLGGSNSGPIADVVATHKRICDAVVVAQDQHVSPKDPYSWVEHGAEMGVVYQSIIIVIDDARHPWRGKTEAGSRDIMFEQFSVLLVRTGNEEHLSEPIDFSILGTAILPLDRDEILHGKQQVVRVRLHTAVRFIMDLERRERDRCPRLTAMKKVLDNETLRDADAYASDALAMAQSNGSIDRNFYTWEAVRRARAYIDGEPFYVEEKLAELDKYLDCDLHHWQR